MTKKIIAGILVITMIFSMMLLSACHKDDENSKESKTVTYTPKEKFLKTAETAEAYFTEMNKALGMKTLSQNENDNKTEVGTFSVELQKLSQAGVDAIEAPVKISGEITTDLKNNVSKMLMEIASGDAKLPVEMIVTQTAYYFNIEKVTDKMIKYANESVDQKQVSELYNEYSDFLMDSIKDDLFTSQTGKATVDGKEISDADTITFKITEKQLGEAIIAVLEKAKADAKLQKLVSILTQDDTVADTFADEIDSMIDEIRDETADAPDSNSITITVINEKNVLRSLEIKASGKENKTFTFGITTTSENKNYSVKGTALINDVKVLELNYQQTANDKGSADGNFGLTVYLADLAEATKGDESSEATESDDGYSYDFSESTPDEIKLEAEFKGTKTDNTVELDIDLKIGATTQGVEVNFPIDLVYKYTAVSDTEITASAEISLNIAQNEAKIVISGGAKLVDYTAIEVPADDKVEVADENYDFEALIAKISTEYPGIAELLSSISGQNTSVPAGMYLYNEDQTETINLYDDGTGSILNYYEDFTFGDGTYSATYAGEAINGTFVVDGQNVTIDGVSGFVMQEGENYTEITNDNIIITLYADGTCSFETYMEYTMENGKLSITYPNGNTSDFDYVENGETYTINGTTYNWDYIYE